MKCPSCNEFAPDTNYKCPHCSSVLKQGLDPLAFKKTAQIKSSSNKTALVVLITILLVAIGIYFKFISSKNDSPPVHKRPVSRESLLAKKRANPVSTNKVAAKQKDTRPQVIEDVNVLQETEPEEEQPAISSIENHIPGENIDVLGLVEVGKTNIFGFYSDYYEECRKIASLLEKLAQKRSDIRVFKIKIDRQGKTDTDWQSPVARQYNLKRIPHFIIYNQEAIQTHEGPAAYNEVIRLINNEKIQ